MCIYVKFLNRVRDQKIIVGIKKIIREDQKKYCTYKIVSNLGGEVKTSAPWGIKKKYYSRSTHKADVVETPVIPGQGFFCHLCGFLLLPSSGGLHFELFHGFLFDPVYSHRQRKGKNQSTPLRLLLFLFVFLLLWLPLFFFFFLLLLLLLLL